MIRNLALFTSASFLFSLLGSPQNAYGKSGICDDAIVFEDSFSNLTLTDLSLNERIKRIDPLVRRLAKQMITKLPANVEVDDLVQAGRIAVSDAIDRFDPALGVKLETFLTQRIRGAMLDQLRGSDWMPRELRRLSRAIDESEVRLRNKLGREPRASEIAREMNMSTKEYSLLVAQVRGKSVLSLEDLAIAAGLEEGEFLDSLNVKGAPSYEPQDRISERQLAQIASDAIRTELSDRERLVWSKTYDDDWTGAEIARLLGVTESRENQILKGAQAKVRAKVAEAMEPRLKSPLDRPMRTVGSPEIHAIAARVLRRRTYEVWKLHVLDGKSLVEVASILNIGIAEVRRSITVARRNIAKAMGSVPAASGSH